MKRRDKTINDCRLRGDTVPEIADFMNLSIPSIDRILSKKISIDYRKSTISTRDNRQFSTNAERVQRMMTTVIESLENELDRMVTDEDRLKLAVRVSELSKILGTPLIDASLGGPPPVILVPDTANIDDFNRTGVSSHSRSGPQTRTQIPQPTPLSPAGSEMPPPISETEKEEEGMDEIDPEVLDVWGEIERGVEELV